jgi:hypothetical protein
VVVAAVVVVLVPEVNWSKYWNFLKPWYKM